MSAVLDVNVIRHDPEAVRTMLRDRKYDEDILNRFLELDREWRAVVDEGNRLRKERNEASLRISKLSGEEKAEAVTRMREVAVRIGQLEAKVAELEAERDDAV
ncbi:MAG TPA: serine--tRNA ligase, partial [Methanomassiliicoccales archaeon]|nr:serine--tRNA ligase [Methanomassiliicoccales archaeon]